MSGALVLHLAVTWALVGLIWVVQRVHYPLMAHVAAAQWVPFHEAHKSRITTIVGPLMLLEFVCALALLLDAGSGADPILAWFGMALVLVAWGTTAFVSVPLHAAMDKSFDERLHRRLVRTNWIRTCAWSLRGVLAIVMLYR